MYPSSTIFGADPLFAGAVAGGAISGARFAFLPEKKRTPENLLTTFLLYTAGTMALSYGYAKIKDRRALAPAA